MSRNYKKENKYNVKFCLSLTDETVNYFGQVFLDENFYETGNFNFKIYKKSIERKLSYFPEKEKMNISLEGKLLDDSFNFSSFFNFDLQSCDENKGLINSYRMEKIKVRPGSFIGIYQGNVSYDVVLKGSEEKKTKIYGFATLRVKKFKEKKRKEK